MVSFKKYIAEAKSKEELEDFEKNYEKIFNKSKSSKEDDSTPEPKVSTENPPEEEEEEDEIDYEDINIDEKHNESGKLGKSFNNNIIFLNEKKNTSTAEEIKSFFKSGNPFLDGKGSLILFHIGDESVEYKGNTYAITTIKPKTSREKAASFFKEFKSHEDIDFFIALYTVLRNKGVFEKSSIKILNHYLPKEFLNNETLEKIRSVISSEAIEYQSNKKMIYPKSGGANKNFSLFSYIVLYHLLPDITKTTKQNQFKEEVQGIPSSANVRVPEFYAKRKIETDTEEKEDLKVDDGKRGSSNNVEIIKKSEEHNNIEDENDEMSAKVSTEESKKDPDKINKKYEDILQQKTYSGNKIDSIEELDMDLKKLKETFEKIKTDEVDNKFEKIKDEFINNISQNTGEDYKELKKQLKTVKLHGGVLGSATMKLATDNAVKNRTEKAKIEIAESMLNEISIHRNIDKLTHKSGRKEKSGSKIMSTRVSKIIRKQEKIIRENEKSVKDRIEKLTIEYSRRFDSYYNKAEKKVKNLASFKKTIKNALSQQIIDIGYSINMARSTVSSYAGRVEYILREYRNSLLAINEKIKMETEKLDKEKEAYNYKVKEKKFSERLQPRLADIQELLKKEKERKEETKELVSQLKEIENKIYLTKADDKIDEKEKQKRIDAAIALKKKKEEELKKFEEERKEISAELQRREKEEYSEKKEKEQERNKAIDSYLSRDSKSGEGEAPGIVDKIKTFSSETKDAVKNTIDRVQLKKKFDEVKKEFSQKKTISANIKDRMTNFIKKLAEKPSTVETAKIMLDRNRPKPKVQPKQQQPTEKAVNESVFYLTEDELSSNIASKTAELFKPHKLANDKIFINLRKAVNAGDKDAFVKPLMEIKNTLLSGNAPSITILTYTDGMINFMNTVITKIDDLDDKMTDEEYKDVISAVNALNSFIETGLTNLQNQLEKSFSTQPQQEQPQQEQPENIPVNAKAALTTETGEEDEEENEEESEEEDEEPKNLLALAKKKFRSNK